MSAGAKRTHRRWHTTACTGHSFASNLSRSFPTLRSLLKQTSGQQQVINKSMQPKSMAIASTQRSRFRLAFATSDIPSNYSFFFPLSQNYASLAPWSSGAAQRLLFNLVKSPLPALQYPPSSLHFPQTINYAYKFNCTQRCLRISRVCWVWAVIDMDHRPQDPQSVGKHINLYEQKAID